MEITGRLRDDLMRGNLIVFLGAGAGQAVGLHSTAQLAHALFQWAGSPDDLVDFESDLAGLVARLDKNPSFSRHWVNQRLRDYFLNPGNYYTLDHHKTLLRLRPKAIFTTNYDIALELAYAQSPLPNARLASISSGLERAAIYDETPGRLPYYKIYGCCRELDERPATAARLVITRADFRDSIARNTHFYERLRDWAYTCSVLFIGFQAQRPEADHLMSYVIDAYNQMTSYFQQPFPAYAVLPDMNLRLRDDLLDSGIVPIEGRFEEFVGAAERLLSTQGSRGPGPLPSGGSVTISLSNRQYQLTLADIEQYSPQFTPLYDGFMEQQASPLRGLSPSELADALKSSPSLGLLASGYYIDREIFEEMTIQLRKAISKAGRDRATQIVWMTGKRGCGKSTLALQALWYAYQALGQPAIILNRSASYSVAGGDGTESVLSGWNEQLLDKFLSRFSSGGPEEDPRRVIPILLVDHIAHKAMALDSLLNYLENHAKPCVVITTLSDEELGVAESSGDFSSPSARNILRLKNLYSSKMLPVSHLLSDDEVSQLFHVVARVHPRMTSDRDRLLQMAKDPYFCDRDILMILYTWFDERYRRFEEIVSDEVGYVESNQTLKDLYLATAVFHQYYFWPRLSLCAQGMNISIEAINELRGQPIFRALFTVYEDGANQALDCGATRHPVFSRRILNKMVPSQEDQVGIMSLVLGHCRFRDLEFARGFLNHIYDYGVALGYKHVQKLKVATERHLSKDYVLNHQFAAYLIRENLDLKLARYYLDLALFESEGNPSIIHTLGNLEYRKYRELLPSDAQVAREHFLAARAQLARSRAFQRTGEEHVYYTEISMLRYRLQNDQDPSGVRALLEGERQALLLEALRVIPKERQNLLRNILGFEKRFHQLPESVQAELLEQIWSGTASHILVEYFGRSLLDQNPRSKDMRQTIATLINKYWNQAKSDPQLATVVALLAKYSFAKNAESRFDLLQPFYDTVVRYDDAAVNFALLAEYVRLLSVDALVLGRYQFLRSTIRDVVDLFRHSKPKFLGEEYILPTSYYCFPEDDSETPLTLFLQGLSLWESAKSAEQFEGTVNLRSTEASERFFTVLVDPVTGFYIRGIRREIASKVGTVNLTYSIKYTYDGFLVSDLRV